MSDDLGMDEAEEVLPTDPFDLMVHWKGVVAKEQATATTLRTNIDTLTFGLEETQKRLEVAEMELAAAEAAYKASLQ